MSLAQLAHLKRWHVQHRWQHPVEFQAWDVMLTVWLLGWIGGAAALVLDAPGTLVLCVGLSCVPSLYVWGRESLHRRGRLRCDWLDSLHAAQRSQSR